MNPVEAQQIIEYIGDLWPKWKAGLNTAQAQLWHDELRPRDYETARLAVRGLARASRYSPTIADYLKAYNYEWEQKAKPVPQDQLAEWPKYTGFWVVGRKSEAMPWHGHPILCPNKKAAVSPDGYKAQAESMRKTLEQMYGGQFVVVQQDQGREHMDPAIEWNRQERAKKGVSEVSDRKMAEKFKVAPAEEFDPTEVPFE